MISARITIIALLVAVIASGCAPERQSALRLADAEEPLGSVNESAGPASSAEQTVELDPPSAEARGCEPRPLAECSGLDLRGQDFAGQALTGANFTGANLEGVSFDGAVLDDADLAGANLTRVTFRDSSLQRVDLSQALLRTVDFRGANLFAAKLAGAQGLQSRWSPYTLGANFSFATWVDGTICRYPSHDGCRR